MKKRNSFTKIFLSLLLIILVAGTAFVYVSPQFEKNAPIVEFQENVYWNLRDKLKIKLLDDSGIKYYKVTFKDNNSEKVLVQEVLVEAKKEILLDLEAPKLNMFFKGSEVSIIVEAIDNSKWNFFDGNRTMSTHKVFIDKKRPEIDIISNSYAIRRGGSAVVVVKVDDANLKDAYISFSKEERFELIPFYKENYYIALVGWPVNIQDFSGVHVVAMDKANNFSEAKVPFYIRPLKMKKSNIKISDKFIKNVSTKVIEQSLESIPESLKKTFIKQNNLIRAKNVATIKQVSSQYMNKERVNEFTIKPFKRLKNSSTAGHFGQKRSYYHNKEKIDEAWHLGVDWASVKKADIHTTNKGTVVFNDYLGIYGNTVILDHGFGLQSLYAHMSASSVNVGDFINAKQKVGNTGISGAVLGDHLHFGVLVQGVEVNPLEWMDKNWIKTRILDIIKDAKEVIDNK